MTSAVSLRWASVEATSAGRIRSINQDRALSRGDLGIWAVADGAGGHQAGEVASASVIDALGTDVLPRHTGLAVQELRRRLIGANARLRMEALLQGHALVGSTVVVLLASGGYAVILWAGDSRAYLLRRGRFRRLSTDHSRVQELIDREEITEIEAERHPASNVITRAVGADDALNIDAQILAAEIGDRFLLCSDGLTKELADGQIAALLGAASFKNIAAALVDRACEHGGRDNVTAVVVETRRGWLQRIKARWV